jgi:hypothetical protein
MINMSNAYNILVRKLGDTRTLRSLRYKWEDIRMDLNEIWCEDLNGIHLAQNRTQ